MVKKIEEASTSVDDSISPEDLARVGQYLYSPQFGNLSYSIANVLVCQTRKTDDTLELIKDELKASIEEVAGTSVADLFTDTIFAALIYAVERETTGILTRRPSLRAEAESVKIVASIAAASTRNTALLRSSTQIADYLEFEHELQAQICSLHATMRIPHAGTTRQVPYDQLFIPPRLEFTSSTSDVNIQHGIKLEDLLKYSGRSVILGDPGGGKSTLALKLAYDIASQNIANVKARVPLLVVLRDYAQQARGANRTSILQYLHNLSRTPYAVEPPDAGLEYLLLNGRALVIFDGLDELIDTSLRRDVVQTVEGFAYRYPTAQIVVTSRRIGYEEAPLNPDLFPALQLTDLNKYQVEAYASKWFELDEGRPHAERQQMAVSFLRDSDFVSDLRVNPLMLSLMCGIYATENYIPRNRPEVYEKCALLLFERWDKQRGIQVSLSFDAHVYAAMRSLALYMYSQEQPQLRRSALVNFIKKYLLDKRFEDADIAEAAAEEFIDFCKGRAWVLTDVGEEKYGFTHRTFLEYFSASQLVRLHPSAQQLFTALQDHLGAREWDVVAQLALQILGKTVEDGADDFLDLVIQAANNAEAGRKVNLLSFAARAVQFIVPRPRVLRAVVNSAIEHLVSSPMPLIARKAGRSLRRDPDDLRSPSTEAAIDLLGVAAELRPDVGRLARDAILNHLREDGQTEQLIAYATIPWTVSSTSQEAIRIDWKFWEAWTQENWMHFSEYISQASTRYYWVDILCLAKNAISINDLISKHGPRVLYEYRIAGFEPYPPIAYDLLLNHKVRLLQRRPASHKARKALITSLNETLPSIPTPWLRPDDAYERLLLARRWPDKARAKLPDQLVLLLSAPLAELEHHFLSRARNVRTVRQSTRAIHEVTPQDTEQLELPIESLQLILESRHNANIQQEAIEFLNRVNLSPSVRELMRRWILGEEHFVEKASLPRDSSP